MEMTEETTVNRTVHMHSVSSQIDDVLSTMLLLMNIIKVKCVTSFPNLYLSVFCIISPDILYNDLISLH